MQFHRGDDQKYMVCSALQFYVLRALVMSGPNCKYNAGMHRDDVLKEAFADSAGHAEYSSQHALAHLQRMLDDGWVKAVWEGTETNAGPRLFLTDTGNLVLAQAFRFLAVAGGCFRTCPECGERIDNFADPGRHLHQT